ncbi:MAG TPA: peptidoglycan bridge formation glycyltransferase FemA/FemB family protein [Armatimonadota bacterium]|nr:peptidoglycan bridge formation glycyltransferase FemA/FemB family protein [Armatimonadota bacterium]
MLIDQGRKSEWNDFVAASAYPNVMQSWQWGELKAATGWRMLPVAVTEGPRIRACALVLVQALPHVGRTLFYAPRGPVCDFSDRETLSELLTEIRTLARQHRAVALKIDPCVPDERRDVVRTLQAEGFRFTGTNDPGLGGTQPRYVMKTNLTPEPDELLASFHSKWRYNIRLAERKGVAMRDCTRDDLPEFYALLGVTAQRDGFRVRTRDYFERMYDLLVPEGMMKLFAADYEGRMIAGAILFRMGHTAVYVYGASANEHRNLMPNHLMQWRMMLWAREQGCTVYDFRGVTREVDGEPEGELGGLNRFKRGFAAQYMEYIGEWDLVLSPTWYGLYALARRVRGG